MPSVPLAHALAVAAALGQALDVADLAPPFGELEHQWYRAWPGESVPGRLDWARADLGRGTILLDPERGQLVSHTLHARRPFDQALLSWNVDVPDGASFCVELQVADDAGASPWLYVGDWGRSLAAGERVTRFEGGRVDVDILRCERPFDRLRFRVRALGGPGGVPLSLRSMVLCLSDSRRARDGAGPPPLPTPLLDVPPRSQQLEASALRARICSPTAVAMVLAYHGADTTTARVAEACFDRAHDIYGNWPRAVQSAWQFGVPGCLLRFSSWEGVRALLARNVPLVVSVRAERGQLTGAPYASTAGHLIVLAGVDEGDVVVVNDPAAPGLATVRRRYRREELERAWLGNGGVAYALFPPGSDPLSPPPPPPTRGGRTAPGRAR